MLDSREILSACVDGEGKLIHWDATPISLPLTVTEAWAASLSWLQG